MGLQLHPAFYLNEGGTIDVDQEALNKAIRLTDAIDAVLAEHALDGLGLIRSIVLVDEDMTDDGRYRMTQSVDIKLGPNNHFHGSSLSAALKIAVKRSTNTVRYMQLEQAKAALEAAGLPISLLKESF